MHDAIPEFESKWLSEFWPPTEVQGDMAFHNPEFTKYLTVYDIRFRSVPPRRHNKNVLESKHRILRDIYLRLKSENPTQDPRLLVAKMFRISNDLYGNNVASAHELAKGYTRPVTNDYPRFLPQEIRKAHNEILAKRKLNLILTSKSISNPAVHVGDIVQVFLRLQNQKRGSWSEPQPVLEYDPSSGTVTVVASHGRRRQAAVEDTRHALSDNELAAEVQQAIDQLDSDVDANLELLADSDMLGEPSSENNQHISFSDHDDVINEDQFVVSMEDDSPNEELPHVIGDNEENINPILTHYPIQPSTFDPDDPDSIVTDQPAQPAQVAPALPSHTMVTRSMQPHSSLLANEIELLPGTELSSSEQQSLQLYHNRFKSKDFMLRHAEGLPSYTIANAYMVEEQNFVKECVRLHRSKVPSDANVIRSHVIYKIKTRDDDSLTCKARIAPHGNEDSERENLKTDSACCPLWVFE